jgi:hypothetical protein
LKSIPCLCSQAVTAANHTLQEFKLKEMEQAKEAERAMETYAKKKAEVMAERERRVKEKQAMKEAERKRVADQIESNFSDWMSKVSASAQKECFHPLPLLITSIP